MEIQLARHERNFYDGGLPETAPDPQQPPVIVLERIFDGAPREFRMARRIAYRDREYGELLVPADPGTFETDLTSVPALFAWLVPRTGTHLPAALLHDGLIYSPGQPPSYISTDGFDLNRVEANRVFRDAMADTGTHVVRRWLMWSAVTTATMIGGRGTGWSPAKKWGQRVVAIATIAIISALGFAATLDLFDVHARWVPQLPWMGERAFPVELLAGGAAAVVIPLLLSLAWGRLWAAGVITGISLALLLHVTVAILALTLVYQLLERLATRKPMIALGLMATLAVASLAGFAAALF